MEDVNLNPMSWLEEFVYDCNLFAVMITFLGAFSQNVYALLSFCFLLILLLAQFLYYIRQMEKEKNPKKFNPLKFWNPSSRENDDINKSSTAGAD
jgi:hypothetical protein